jgi:DNA-directed RNA polymerase subunit RPC12/RpoP
MERETERPDDLYKCIICGAKFDSREELEQHESKCANKQPAS